MGLPTITDSSHLKVLPKSGIFSFLKKTNTMFRSEYLVGHNTNPERRKEKAAPGIQLGIQPCVQNGSSGWMRATASGEENVISTAA
ncbi:hypothetical protein P7K49_014667 [Saguinus oedipus]|uniref:Uncharacterized protein n=1 Tax=Saguinus oedipus TaxID=9490 RepID=A0ABQ9V704_SAGOE|nr:hypothetical protein P7K49_014667 [Saguinus oedipus]